MEELLSIFGSGLRLNELLLVKAGIKPALRMSISTRERASVEKYLKATGLKFAYSKFKIIEIPDVGKGGFSNKGLRIDFEDKREGNFFIYISKDESLLRKSKTSEQINDNIALGVSLGYPLCCVDFFNNNSTVQSSKQNDYVLPALNATKGIEFPYENNICARYFDYSLINHFPCTLDCKESEELGKKYEKVLGELRPKYINQLREMLKSVVIYTEYDGVFLIPNYQKNGNNIFYKTVHYTQNNEITKLLTASNHLEILSKSKVKIGKHLIENVNTMVFK